MTTLLERFIPESREYLESASAGLLKLERTPSDDGLINEVFRAVHTLKGASGLFDVPGLTRLLHAGEDLLGAVRANQLALDSPMVDLLLDALDKVSGWVDALESEGCLPEGADGVSALLSKRLCALLPSSAGDDQTECPVVADEAPPPAWLEELPAASRARALAALADGATLQSISYNADESCFYRAEDPFNLLMQLPGLISLQVAPREQIPLSEIDPFRSVLDFRALVAQPRAEIEQLFRYVLDQIVIAAVPLEVLDPGAAERAVAEFSASSGSSMAARILGEQIRIVDLPADPDSLKARIAAVEATIANLSASLGWTLQPGELEAAGSDARSGQPERLQHLLNFLRERASPRFGIKVTQSVPAEAALVNRPAVATLESRQPGRVLKVDQGKVDRLMTLIGEMVVSKNALPFLARRAEEIYGSREMSREIKDQYAVIDRLAQEMQRAILDVRMLPVSEVFERFPRLVRDLSRRLEKQITLKVIGEDTAADKNIIEALGDPLIHLVRNAIDHGIELPEQRVEMGKPEAATILLRAFQEGDQVVIEVSDDGKGIDPQAIKLKAFEKGLISEDRLDRLSDQEAINLIFLPGFSTAQEVSDLSGRGVGMDVVRSAVEKINGQVLLSSRQGEGTLVRLSLPLSMAVSRVMMVEVGDGLFGVPMDGVVETVKLPVERIKRIKQAEAFVLRDAIIPLLRMHELLQVERQSALLSETREEAVLVAKVGGKTVGLVVDRFREGIDVILKPMDGLLAGMRGYSGSALLGDGRVLLVLNLKELL
jgi:two-component system chemotaxis sensor kinase CheA